MGAHNKIFNGTVRDAFWKADWERAECRNENPELFFPVSKNDPRIREAKKICNQCEIRLNCLQYAMDADERDGIWGGMTETERDELRIKMAKSASYLSK